jgi:hypothetical protein
MEGQVNGGRPVGRWGVYTYYFIQKLIASNVYAGSVRSRALTPRATPFATRQLPRG